MVTPHGLHIARSTLQVPLKGLRNIENLDDVIHTKRLLLVDCKSLSCAYCILDLLQRSAIHQGLNRERELYLSTIEIAPGKPIIIIGREVINFNAITNSLDLAKKCFPYAVLSLRGEIAVTKSHVNARLEGRIESFDAVGGQEEDALKVFKKSQEDANECVAADVLGLASLCNTASVVSPKTIV